MSEAVMEKHRLNIFPEMLSDDYNRLLADIKSSGYDKTMPIVTYEGKILDGWHRYKVCQKIGVEPVFNKFIGREMQALEFVVRTNNRRNLTSSQWAVIGVEANEIIEILKQEARERQVEGGKNKVVKQIVQAKTDDLMAEMFNTNAQYIRDARKLKAEQPEIFKQIREGNKTITEATREIKRQERNENLKNIADDLPSDIFQVIYADPAWEYSNSGFEMSAENQYPTMPTDKIKALRPKAADDAICFLWVTNPLLKDGLSVLEAWGFEYKTNMVWVKDKHTAGFYVFGQHELLLIGARGSMLPIGEKVKSIITGKNDVHSKKPESVYEIIETMYPNLKCLEMFARNKRDGWISWGNQCEQ